MGAQQEAAVQHMLKAWSNGKETPDVDRIVSAFAPEGSWTLYMPNGPTITGRDALRAEIRRQVAYCGNFDCEVLQIASGDGLVIAERRDRFTRNGVRMECLVAGVLELNAENQIVAWRDYFDVLDFARKGNADPATLSGLEQGAGGPSPVPEATADGLSVALQPARTPEQQFIADFCDAWGDGSDQSRPDVERILSMMAEDAEWQLWVPGGPTIGGRDALRQEILRQMQYATNNKCNIVKAVSSKKVVLQERSDWAVMRGRPCPHQMIAIYELDDDGLIQRWREYINMADLDRKRGTPAGQAHVGTEH